jgi:hypothetical protein
LRDYYSLLKDSNCDREFKIVSSKSHKLNSTTFITATKWKIDDPSFILDANKITFVDFGKSKFCILISGLDVNV